MMRKFVLLALACAALPACFDSGGGNAPAVAESINTTEMAECNSVNISSINMVGQMTTYYDSTTEEIVPGYLLLNLTSYPAALLTSSSVQIEFVPWYEVINSEKIYSTTPLFFYFMDKSTGVATAPVSALNLASIKSAITQLDYLDTNTTLDEFFSKAMIVLIGVSSTYEAVTVAYYDSATSSSPAHSGDVLMPAFYADPNAFAQAYPLADLYNLHPFASYVGQANTGIDFGVLDDQICLEVTSSDGRAPASLDDDDKAARDRKLKAAPYLAAGKAQSQRPRGEPQYNMFGKIWHSIVESLSMY